MKKQLLLLVMMLLPMVTNADTVVIDGIYYNLISKIKEAEVTKNPSRNKYTGDIEIPASVTHNGIEYSVTSISNYAFQSCNKLTSIILPQSVTNIGEDAFSDCFGLSSIAIPNSVVTIGANAFYGCRRLTSITIPNNITSIGKYAFQGCSSLETIIVESGNNYYDSRDDCNAIIESSTNRLICGCMNTIIPNSVKTIGILAFSGCTGLTSISIPSSVASIEDNAFEYCSGLKLLTISNGLNSIGSAAFRECI